MANSHAQLDGMIERIKALPELARQAAPDVVVVVEQELHRTIAAGTTPEGKPWAPKKKGSGQPLQGAAEAVRVTFVGTKIYARVSGHHARHHKGWAKGGTQRAVIPLAGIPAPMAAAIKRVLDERFRQAVKP